MYLSIILLPLLSALTSGLLGRKIGVKGSQLISCTCLIITTLLALISFYEVGLKGSAVTIKITDWISLESLYVGWEFNFDSLTVSMLLPVLIVSTLVHIYSISYMDNDPHNQRFFSYLSMFTFFMLILVTGNNYLILFIGWEGSFKCLKCLDTNIITQSMVVFGLPSYSKISSKKRIGPHNIDIISLIIGSTLGDTQLEKRKKGLGTRVIFEQCSTNVEYLMWFHSYLSQRGYSNVKKPNLKKRITSYGILYFYRINSFTFYSLNWIHDMFYKQVNNKWIKIVPIYISDYLTPMSLAV